MKEKLYTLLSWAIVHTTTKRYDSFWEEKLPHVILGILGLILFCLIFTIIYWKYLVRYDKRVRKLFIVSEIILGVLYVAKYMLSFFTKGYWSERWIIYALPSPRLSSMSWLVASALIAFLCIYFHHYLDRLKRWQFLLITMSIFVGFSLTVAGIRGGIDSIIEPLTRTYWESTGALPFIKNIPDFLRNFITLLPQLPIHVRIHPPGYPLILFFWQHFFSAGLLGMAVLLIVTASLAFVPIFYVAQRLCGDSEARSIVKIMIFLPALVLFSATSMEAVFVSVVSYALVAAFFGWKEKMSWSVAAGILTAFGVLCNFLFLLLGPCFLAFAAYLIKTSVPTERWKIVLRIMTTSFFFVSFFVFLRVWTGYSLITNFFVAHNYNKMLVESNFASIFTYFGYMLMNIIEFGFYLGVPLLIVFVTYWPESFKKSALWFKFGLINLILFLMIGIFQGEVGRIWLFVAPFFLFFYNPHLITEKKYFVAILSLLAAQIITVQLLFYTFW